MNTQTSAWFPPTLLFAFCAVFWSQVQATSVVSEKITFLNEDGTNYVRYDTTRTEHQTYEIWFNKGHQRNPEYHLDNYLYLYPNAYRWDTDSQAHFDLMKIASGSFASLVDGGLDSGNELRVSEDGVFTFTNWDGKTRTPKNHFGVWNDPEPFSKLVYAWVFPINLNVISYEANRHGKWVKRNNTITYYGDNVNDLVFTIKYQPVTAPTYQALLREFVTPAGAMKDVRLEQSTSGVKITLMTRLLFSSGSTELSESGQTILQQLARTLAARDDLKIIIEGHTDNVPIKDKLAKRYKTNWELSSARSLKVLHFLVSQGVQESSLEARAHAANIPVEANTSKSGRAQNRRIEILLVKEDS